MRWKTIRYSRAVKTAAFLLAIGGLVIGVLGTAAGLYAIDRGWEGHRSYFDTNSYQEIVRDHIWRAEETALYDYTDEGMEPAKKPYFDRLNEDERFAPENTNIAIEVLQITEEGEKEVASTFTSSFVDQVVTEDKISLNNGEVYLFRALVSQALPVKDALYYEKNAFVAYGQRSKGFLGRGIAGILLWFVATVYLILAAGRHGDRETVRPEGLDRIPYDLYLILTAGLMGLAVCLPVGVAVMRFESMEKIYYYYYGTISALLTDGLFLWTLVIAGLVIGALLTMSLMSLSTRVKAGKWWRNTLIYMILRLLWRGLKCVGRTIGSVIGRSISWIPLVWKTGIASGLMFLLVIIFAGIGEPESIFLAVLFAMLGMAGLLYCAISMRKLQKAGRELAAGNEGHRVNTEKLRFDFREHGENLNSIGKGMRIAVEQQMKSERMKTELITNVSHDLKTPLTSIINYVDLLSKENLEGQAGEYVAVLSRQAARMKKLTEDVVDASKASTGNIPVNLTNTDAFEIINQATGEYRERLEENRLELVVKNETAREHIMISADGRLLWRAIDNLMSNICKYSQDGTRVYVNVRQEAGTVVISFKNISKGALDIDADELMERFVRGDSSRSTEGSGLGLNIARSLLEIQGGHLTLAIDGDLFKAEIRFQLLQQ